MVTIPIELKMRVIIVEKDKEPQIEKIWNDLETLRKRIGNNNLEVIEYDKETLLVYGADTLLNNIPINRYLDDLAIRGTFIIAGNNLKEMDFKSLTDEQIEEYLQMLKLERFEEEEFEV